MANSRKSATLASMVPATPVAPETASAAVAGTVAPAADAKAAINWDAFAAPTIAVYTRNEPVTIDREASTPAFIKNAVNYGFEAYQNAEEKDKPRQWVVLPLDSSETVEQFMKLARLYAKFKGYTLRGGENPKVKAQARFLVKPLELRKKAQPEAVAA